MKRLMMVVAAVLLCVGVRSEETSPEAVSALLERIGGEGASELIVTVLDEDLAEDSEEVFVITSSDGKPCVKGSTLSALTAGLGWYLNHYARVNLAWNNLTTDLTAVSLPVPSAEEKHTTEADYRYYLNYCTFSYSMSVWTWERWQEEIDWMALHGINMPLQIVGLDVVWRNLLVEDLGYTADAANDFIAGPCYQAWWGMNNLEGWGGKNAEWWYERQETLAKNIVARERELGMEPVLPGYSGMVPSDIGDYGYDATSQGSWNYFQRPYILDPTSDAFTTIAAKYYARLEEVMGTSGYYSMDPFHEGANTGSIDVASAYTAIGDAMLKVNEDAKWVIQFWQWSSDQYYALSQTEVGDLIVLDLFSDAHTHFGDYQGHDAVYCLLNNFGARTGFYGRLTKILSDYYSQASSYSNIKGVGATSEGIEQTPILYDALYELPWRSEAPDAAEWVEEYTRARYGTDNETAQEAWEKLRTSSLNCSSTLQGPMEAVVCARPVLSVGAVSSWGGTDIFYDAQEVARATHLLLNSGLSGENFGYDLTDLSRQTLTDYGYYLLKGINSAYGSDDDAYAMRRDLYLDLILSLDTLLCTNENFMLGRWTQMARAIAAEETTTAKPDSAADWLELSNARTLITTWGDYNASEYGGLRDYSYREWGGMMKDFYYNRWKLYFDALDGGSSTPSWFDHDWTWAHSSDYSYSDEPEGDTYTIATRLLERYMVPVELGGYTFYAYRGIETDLSDSIMIDVYRGSEYELAATVPSDVTATLWVDYDNDGDVDDGETSEDLTTTLSTEGVTGKVTAMMTLSDGTELTYILILHDEITEDRTVTVVTADSEMGSVSIEGSDELSVTNREEVTIVATAATGYEFNYWVDSEGNRVSTENPYTYYGADEETFTAYFYVSKWTIPTESLDDWSTIEEYGQYLTTLTLTQNGQDPIELYSTDECPESLFHITEQADVPDGSQFILTWAGPNTTGLAYCRLSAYIDLNCDGDFDDDDECLGTIGSTSTSGNTAVAAGSLTVLLPYGVPQGVTRVRMRFDSSYLTDDLDATTGAMPADADTKRMIYDVPINVTEYAAQECTVTVASANTELGTVDANGQTTTYTYQAGEEIVLRAYPAADTITVTWKDQYSREVPESWYDGNFLRFKAPESGTYTAYFSTGDDDDTEVEGLAIYTIVSKGRGTFTVYTEFNGDSSVPTVQSSEVTSYYSGTQDTSDDCQHFILYPTGNTSSYFTDEPTYYLYSVSQEMIVNTTSGGLTDGLLSTDEPIEFVVQACSMTSGYEDYYALYSSDGNERWNFGGSYQTTIDYYGTWQWAADDDGNALTFNVESTLTEWDDITTIIETILYNIATVNATEAEAEEAWQAIHDCITDLADLSSNKTYYLKTARGGYYYYDTSTTGIEVAGTSVYGKDLADRDDAAYFEFQLLQHDGDAYFIYNKGANALFAAPVAKDYASVDNRAIAEFTIAVPSASVFSGYGGDASSYSYDSDSEYLWWIGNADSTMVLNYSGWDAGEAITYFDTMSSWAYTDDGNVTAIQETNNTLTPPNIYDVTIKEAMGYATLALPEATLVPTGITPYIATECGTDAVTIDQAVSSTDAYNILPAGDGEGLGFIVAGDAGTYYFPNITSEGTADVATTGNLLYGVINTTTYLDLKAGYLLVNDGNDTPVFKLSGGLTVPQYKAYLPAGDGSASQLSISFGGIVEGVGSATVTPTDGLYYDLQGRRVLNPVKGAILIHNGRVIIR